MTENLPGGDGTTKLRELIVGNEPWTSRQIVDILKNVESKLLSTSDKLLAVAIRLELPAETYLSMQQRLSTSVMTLSESCFEILEAWRGKSYENARLEVLVRVLEKSELPECADALRGKMTETQRIQSFLLVSAADIVESTKWNDLSDALKLEMGSKNIALQGKKVPINSFGPHLLSKIDGRLLTQLAKNEIPEIVKKAVSEVPAEYIEREVCRRTRLTQEVFKHNSKDVIAVEGIAEDELSALVGKDNWSFSGKQLKQILARFFILKHREHFEELCTVVTPGTSVHWVKHNNNTIEWVKSYGSVKPIQKYVAAKQDIITETQILSDNIKNVIISDTPGTGKTYLLVALANKALESENQNLVQVIDLYEFMHLLNDKEPDINTIFSTIAMHSANSEWGRRIILHLLKSKSSLLFFDGFNDLLPQEVPLAISVLQKISNSKNIRSFVASRLHMRNELEEALQTFGFTIKPIGISNQHNILGHFWSFHGVAVDENVNKFALSCIEQLSQNISCFEQEILGVVSQCGLLAALYLPEAKECEKQERYPIISVSSVVQLIDRYIIGQLDDATFIVRSKLDLTESQLSNPISILVDLKHFLRLCAIQTLHPNIADSYEHLNQSVYPISILQEGLTAVGILKPSNSGRMRFRIPTFAEYVFACYAFDNLLQGTLPVNIFTSENFRTESKTEVLNTPYGVLDTITYHKFKQPAVAYFVNGMLLDNFHITLPLQELSKLCSSLESGPFFFASAFHNLTCFPLFVIKYYLQQRILKDSPKQTHSIANVLLTAAKYSNVDLIKTLFSKVDINNIKKLSESGSYPITPLHVAAQRGYYNLVEYLVTNKFDPESANLKFLLHFCTFESNRDPENILNEKKKIIKLLISQNPKWQEEMLLDGSTPLLQSRVNAELVRLMIELGFAINILDKNNDTVLHKLVYGQLQPDTYHQIVVALRKRGFMHFNKANKLHKTPLHFAVEKIDLTEHTLKIFESEGAGFNAVDDEGKSVLLTAIHGGRSNDLISILEKLGAKEMVQDMDTEKLLRLKGTHIRYDPDNELGHGATSIVYKGLYVTTPAAVKKIKSEFVDVYYTELKIWRDMRKTIEEDNLNIVTLHEYVKWEGRNGIAYFFAMELAICDLEKRLDFLKKLKTTKRAKFDVEEAKLSNFIYGAAKGLQWMAKANILHRDIKPANILIFATKTGQEIAKLGDFGISRKISGMSTGTDSAGRGTSDWMAPEAIEAMDQGEDFKFNSTKAIDIFSLGMTAHYTISIGTHPFAFSKQYRSIKAMNIIDTNIHPSTLGHPHYTANHLFRWMMKKPVDDRPKIADVVDHPYFWDCEKSVDFIREVAACLEQKDDPEVMRIRTTIDNQYSKHGQSPDWIPNIGSSAKQALFYHTKKYDTPKHSVMMLVELIRDKYMHRRKMIKFDKDGIFKDGASFCKKKYASYFQNTFPDVLIHIFGVLVNETHPSLGDLRASFYANFGSSKVPLPTNTATAQP